MIVEPRLSNKALAELCHRLTVEMESGVDIRRTWQREAESARGKIRPYFERIREALARGDTFSEALARSAVIFPPLFLEMAHVGEETGTLTRVMRRMERHFQRLVQTRRTFLVAIAWPMIELVAAIGIIGLLIGVMGWVGNRAGGKAPDMLGLGLVGGRGLLIYVTFWLTVVIAVTVIVAAMRRGLLWTRPLERALIRAPVVGGSLQKLALAKMAWVLHLTMNVAMDVRRAAALALRATGNDYYARHVEGVSESIKSGMPLAQALARTGAFPSTFIDTLAVGEESGQIVESMERLADRYEEESEAAIRVLAVLAGALVFALVAALIIWLIFRLFSGYMSSLNEALEMLK
jgi:type IV pilus assembly protein PilC